MWKKLMSKSFDSTPQAPKHKPLPLPELGEGDRLPTSPMSPHALPPAFAESWASSDSGSSVSSSSNPSTPASSPAPWKRPVTPYSRPPPSVRAETPQYEIRSPAWHVMTSDLEKSLCRETFTPSPEIFKPRPQRASSAHHPTPVQVMQGLVSPTPVSARPPKSILKHSVPRSAAPTPAPPQGPSVRVHQTRLHWQLCPFDTYRSERTLRVEFDAAKPVELIAIRDTRPYGGKLPQHKVDEYLLRKVCEAAPGGAPLTEMSIRYPKFAGWSVTVRRADGGPLLVKDVFQALSDDLYQVTTRQDRKEYIPRGEMPRCEEAYKRRCAESLRSVAEHRTGMRRVDLLQGDSFFVGLTRPTKEDQDFWIANFGPAPS
ncbi:hypothetical protein BD310DRAFT_925949 [Dichomitus squalens]|uniref:DUF6699 domain-containing protein n=1 Tax=Dichomitus squalens TaxID=114155 RepID=A0A4Q9PWX4_9APHY|nr:hypothetical protein BD310DRAFT_925949 [Dichomitus squalens]